METVFATLSVQEFIEKMGDEQFKNCEFLANNPLFQVYLNDPGHSDPVDAYNFVTACRASGIPEPYTRDATSLHYLTKAIKARLL